MNDALITRIGHGLSRSVASEVAAFGERLGREAGALAVLFYGSNLRTGELDGVLDFYVLLPGPAERGMWPRVSYHEWACEGVPLRAKVATMTLAKFREAASGETIDTTIWARFCQPAALVWQGDRTDRTAVTDAVAAAICTAARLAAALGPASGTEDAYWLALFEATYRAEFRFETISRAQSILDLNRAHFDGLLSPALEAAGIAYRETTGLIEPLLPDRKRRDVLRWWNRRQRLGKPYNLARVLRASTTFDGAARYAAWKIERHTGVRVRLTPWREKHPVLAAPGVLFSVWKRKRQRG